MRQGQFDQLYRALEENDLTTPDGEPALSTSDVFNGLLICWEDGSKGVFYHLFLMSVRMFLQAEYKVIIMRFTTEPSL